MWSITNSFRQRNDCLKSTLSRLPQVSWFIWALSLPNHVPLAICCWNIAEENPLCIIDILPTIFQNVSNDRSWGWCMWFNRRLLGIEIPLLPGSFSRWWLSILFRFSIAKVGYLRANEPNWLKHLKKADLLLKKCSEVGFRLF